ncbi:MAG: glycosyl transferase [Acidobacteria bacterium]|nr:MAG: glycosyl transferase [Acidobacteriota bacterium]
MTVVNFILGVECLFLLYFLVLYGGYIGLNIISLLTLPRYMQSRVMTELPQSFSGFDLPISIVVPAYNEAAVIVGSIRSLLQLSYPEYEVVIANDGSKDETVEVLRREFGLVLFPEAYRIRIQTARVRGVYLSTVYPNLRVVDKENGGRADALNAAINAARYPLICVIDADSILQRDSLQRVVQPFIEDPLTVACGGTIRIANGCQVRGGFLERAGLPTNLWALFQVIEYLRSFLFGRVGWSRVNGLLIISGAFGVFKKEIVVSIGGYNHATIGEDMELVMRMHLALIERKVPYRVCYVPDPVCWTEAPEDYKTLRSQRIRWAHGLGDCIALNRRLLFKRGSGALGWVALPFNSILEWINPVVEITGFVFVVVTYFLGLISVSSLMIFFLFTVGLGVLLSVSALLLEELSFHTYPKMRHLIVLFVAAIAENFGYRQITSFWGLQGLVRWIVGSKPGWGDMKRNADWQAETTGDEVETQGSVK